MAQQNIPFYLVPGWSHLATVFALVQLLKQIKPRVLIAHGFSEHLWGAVGGNTIAGVPVILHVEHNSRERYTPFRLWLAKQLTKRTRWLVGVYRKVLEIVCLIWVLRRRNVFSLIMVSIYLLMNVSSIHLGARESQELLCVPDLLIKKPCNAFCMR